MVKFTQVLFKLFVRVSAEAYFDEIREKHDRQDLGLIVGVVVCASVLLLIVLLVLVLYRYSCYHINIILHLTETVIGFKCALLCLRRCFED